MNRTEALDYLESQYAPVFRAVGFDMGDLETVLGPAIDDALLALGTSLADLPSAVVSSANVIAYRALLRWSAVRLAYQAALTMVDVSVSDPSVSKQRSQMRDGLRTALADLTLEVAPYVVNASVFETGMIVFGDDYFGTEFRGAWG